MTQSSQSHLRRRLGYLKGAALVLLAGFVTCETGLRLHHAAFSDFEFGALSSFLVLHGDHWVVRPDIAVVQPERLGDIRYSFDSNGFRNGDRPSGASRRRLLFLGDSVTFGLSVGDADTFPRRAESLLNGAGTPGERPMVEAVNLGMFAYAPPNELAVLERYGVALRPAALVLQLYMNDWDPAADGSLPQPPATARLKALKNRLLNGSWTYLRAQQLLGMITYRAFHQLRRAYFSETLNDVEPRKILEYLDLHDEDDGFPGFRALLEIDRLARREGIPLLVLLTPNEVQLYSSDFDGIDARVRAFCARHGIGFYDPLDALRSYPGNDPLYNDGLHFSVPGNRFVAELLAPRLQDLLASHASRRGRG